MQVLSVNTSICNPILDPTRDAHGPIATTETYYHLVISYIGNLQLHNEPIINNTCNNATSTEIKPKCSIFSIQATFGGAFLPGQR